MLKRKNGSFSLVCQFTVGQVPAQQCYRDCGAPKRLASCSSVILSILIALRKGCGPKRMNLRINGLTVIALVVIAGVAIGLDVSASCRGCKGFGSILALATSPKDDVLALRHLSASLSSMSARLGDLSFGQATKLTEFNLLKVLVSALRASMADCKERLRLEVTTADGESRP